MHFFVSDLSRLLNRTRRSPYGKIRPASTKRERTTTEGKRKKEEEITVLFQ
jgi:hypothetical protein